VPSVRDGGLARHRCFDSIASGALRAGGGAAGGGGTAAEGARPGRASAYQGPTHRDPTGSARLGSALSCPSCGKATGQLSTPVADDDMQESFSSSPPGEVGMAELLARCERLEKLVAETAEAVENNSLFLRQRASGNLRGSRVVR